MNKYPDASKEPLDIIEANEAQTCHGSLVTARFQALFNKIHEQEQALTPIRKIVDIYFMPWGAAKAAMWGEIAGDGPFNDGRAMELIHAALHPAPASSPEATQQRQTAPSESEE